MKRIFICVALFSCISATAQVDSIKVDLDKLRSQIDSSNKMMDSLTNASFKRLQDQEMERTRENMDRNMNSFLQLQRENEKKQQQQMWIRIGIGALFAGIFALGIMRRRKKKVS